MKPKAPTKRQCEVMQKHRQDPDGFTQSKAMKALNFGRDYHAFYRLFYRCTVADKRGGYDD
jgi:hypothetical protein